ncbi:hypothetical protein [Enterococcus sp.]|uniref:hypothetical protein n=1 Tax=Enterococcus sp. TaxID=35783 RepID=UPI00289B77FA|nr:hypothetical protein [Enterococcus sp.]
MSETSIATFIGAVVTLAATVLTQIVHAHVEKNKSRWEMQQKEYQSKRERLNEVYKELITIINLFPNSSPNDVLKWVEYAPNYSLETFDAVIEILDYQIDDYKKQLGSANIDYEQKSNIKVQISNREYSKKKICEIRDNYFNARDEYKSFCTADKVLFDLYAGQNVKNDLVKFEVVIHNAFISGHSVGDADDPLNNSIEICRRNLINSMRNDIGIN